MPSPESLRRGCFADFSRLLRSHSLLFTFVWPFAVFAPFASAPCIVPIHWAVSPFVWDPSFQATDIASCLLQCCYYCSSFLLEPNHCASVVPSHYLSFLPLYYPSWFFYPHCDLGSLSEPCQCFLWESCLDRDTRRRFLLTSFCAPNASPCCEMEAMPVSPSSFIFYFYLWLPFLFWPFYCLDRPYVPFPFQVAMF